MSTDEVYGEGGETEDPMQEEHVLEPTNPYAATKVFRKGRSVLNALFTLPVLWVGRGGVPREELPPFVWYAGHHYSRFDTHAFLYSEL